MRIVLQRCKHAKVSVDDEAIGQIGKGVVLLVGITHSDTDADAATAAKKISGLRIFEDDQQKMNLSLADIGGSILSISQFTLYGDCRKGRRPNYMKAARPEQAEPIWLAFNEALRSMGHVVETGRFGAMMDVDLVNWGPVTLNIEVDQKVQF